MKTIGSCSALSMSLVRRRHWQRNRRWMTARRCAAIADSMPATGLLRPAVRAASCDRRHPSATPPAAQHAAPVAAPAPRQPHLPQPHRLLRRQRRRWATKRCQKSQRGKGRRVEAPTSLDGPGLRRAARAARQHVPHHAGQRPGVADAGRALEHCSDQAVGDTVRIEKAFDGQLSACARVTDGKAGYPVRAIRAEVALCSLLYINASLRLFLTYETP